jgi:hypothetical protein
MTPSLEPGTIERRRTARQKSFLRGMVHFNNRRSVLDCLIRDISPYGARLIFSDAIGTPDTLDLHIPQRDQTLRTHVIWRHGREVGVAFAHILEIEQRTDDGPLDDRVAKLEAEVIALKRLIKKLKSDAGPDLDVA